MEIVSPRSLANAVPGRRRELKMSQEELGKQAGVSRRPIVDLISARSPK